MWTARIGTSGSRAMTGIVVRMPRELPARLTARTATVVDGGSGNVTEKVPSEATFTGASLTVTVEGSFTRPARVTGAPRTAGWVGAVISMSGRVWLTVKVQLRLALHGTSGWSIANLRVWVPSSRCSGR